MAELTASQLAQALEDSLAKGEMPLDAATIRSFSAASVLEIETPGDATRRLDRDLLKRDVVYAIPDDTLNLFPELVQAAIAAFGNGPIAALPNLVGLLFRYRTLRVTLTPEEAAVVRILKRAKVEARPPLAPAAIESSLKRDGLLTQKPVAELLRSLVAKHTEKVTLVKETDGRWSIGNV